MAVTAAYPPAECPECGLGIADSLAEGDLQLARRDALGAVPFEHISWKTLLAGMLTLRINRLVAWLVNARRLSGVAIWLVVAAIPTAALTMPRFGRIGPSLVYAFYWEKVLMWTGVAGLLAGLYFSMRIGRNVLYLGQHALVPGVCVAGCLLAILQARDLGVLWTSANDPYLVLGLIVLAVELALLSKVFWLMQPRGRLRK